MCKIHDPSDLTTSLFFFFFPYANSVSGIHLLLRTVDLVRIT